mgnify:CR=1 FL=1
MKNTKSHDLIKLCAGAMLLFSPLFPADSAAAAENDSGNWRGEIRKFAETNFKHPAWGFEHSERDYRLAKELAEADGQKLDDDILYAAAMLHDMGAFPPWADPKADHAAVALSTISVILTEKGFPPEKNKAVLEAVRTHMYESTPEGPEALYLHDADALEWIGAVGAARLLAITDTTGKEPTLPTMIAAIADMTNKIPGRVFSPAGKKEMKKRLVESEIFLRELKEETISEPPEQQKQPVP